MIQRIVLIKLSDDQATPAGRNAVMEHTKTVLTALPKVRNLTINTPSDDKNQQSWDVKITLHFDDMESLEEYRVHPTHRDYVDEFLGPQLAVIKAWNFEVT